MGGAARSVAAVVEGGDHLVLAFDPWVDAGKGTDAVEAEHGQPFRSQCAQISTGSLDPEQLDRSGGDGVDVCAFAEVLPPA